MIEFNDVQAELDAFKRLHYPENDFPVYFDYTVEKTFSEVNAMYASFNYGPLKKEFCKLWLCYLFLTLSRKNKVKLSDMVKTGKTRLIYPLSSHTVKIVFNGIENSPTVKSAKRAKLLKEGAELPPELQYTSKAWRLKKGLA